MDVALSRFPSATLAIAFAASVVVHVSMFAALVGVDAGSGSSPYSDAPSLAPALQAQLVAVTRPASTATALAAPAPAAFLPPTTPPDTTAASATIAKPAPGGSAAERSVVGWKPRVVVNDRVPRARFGEALENDALAAFLVEVDAGVGLPERFDVTYPRSALAARKEGSVLVWAVIDDHGGVDSVHVVEGDSEFAEAVEAALRGSQFAPARNLGQPVPFYVTLEFEFRLDAMGGAVAAQRTGGVRSR